MDKSAFEGTYILELTEDQVLLIAQLLHIHLKSPVTSGSVVATDALNNLKMQTDCVVSDPWQHYVYTSKDLLKLKVSSSTKSVEKMYEDIHCDWYS